MKNRVEQDLADELMFHFEQESQRQQARGLSPEAARVVVRRQAYGLEALKDACRDVRGVRWIDDALSDIRYAVRTFRRNPGFAMAAVLSSPSASPRARVCSPSSMPWCCARFPTSVPSASRESECCRLLVCR